jgi:hypothetical protein
MQEPSSAQQATSSTPASSAATAPALTTTSQQHKIWLLGGTPHHEGSESHSSQPAALYQLTFDSDGLPAWAPMDLPQAPNFRIGANIGSVGPVMFQYSGSDSVKANADSSSSAATSEAGTTGGVHALCTFSDELILPKWIDLSNFNNKQGSRAHSASAIVGATVWIHGGETSAAVGNSKRRALVPENALWSLVTSPAAPAPNVACPRGFERRPPPFGPCVDTGEA